MALKVSDPIQFLGNRVKGNLDDRYGPYNFDTNINTTLQNIINSLKTGLANLLSKGLKVGIIIDNKIVEYTFQGDPSNPTVSDFEHIINPKDLEYSNGTSFLNNNGYVNSDPKLIEISDKIDKLPTGIYYGQYDSEEDLEDVQVTTKGYAYISSTDPAVYYIYLYDSNSWTNSGNKFVTTNLETDLSTKSQTKAPTTKVVAEGIEAIDVTLARSAEDENELTAAQKYNASANINDRAANVVHVTNEVKALGYKVLNTALSFSEQVENVVENETVIVDNSNTIFEIRDEFDLNNGSVTIPANCILKFNGGKLSGGTLTVNSIEAPRVKIFDDVTLANAPTNEVYPEWFGAVADGVTDCFAAMQAAVSCTNVTVRLGKGTYYCNGKLTPANNVVIEGHGRDLSTIRCNGIDMRTFNILRNLTLKPINLQTEYLVSVKDYNINDSIASVIISDITLRGTTDDSNLVGIYLLSDRRNGGIGMENITIKNVYTLFCIHTVFKFEAKGGANSYPWMTVINITDVFSAKCKRFVDFIAEAGINSVKYSFQGITFDNASAQYVSGYGDYFVGFDHCQNLSFTESCNFWDSNNNKIFYFKSNHNYKISINKYSYANTLKNLIRVADGMYVDKVYYDILTTNSESRECVSSRLKTFSYNTIPIPNRAPASPYIQGRNITGVRGIGITNSTAQSNTGNEGIIGFNSNNQAVIVPPISSEGTPSSRQILYEGEIPYGWAFPSAKRTGDIYYYRKICGYIVYDDGTFQTGGGPAIGWYDMDGVKITSAITARIGTSSTRVGMTLTSTHRGFRYYDTTLSKWVCWNGSAWEDANGETVGLQVNDTSILIAAAQNSSKTINVYSASAITAVSQVIDETSITYTTGSTADTIESTSYYAGSAISLNEGDIIRIDGTAVILNSSKGAIVAFTSGKSYIASGTETIYIATTTADTDVVYIKGNWLEASVGTASGSTYPVTLKALSANSTAPRGAKVIITNNSEVVIINVVQSY